VEFSELCCSDINYMVIDYEVDMITDLAPGHVDFGFDTGC
jgi:hypothetical protein